MKPVERFGFPALWMAAALCAAAMFYFWQVNANYLGIVETRTHKLGLQEPGRIRQLLVSLGDEVKANQLLVQLDTSDLDSESAWIREELANLDKMMAADRRRYALEYDQLMLQRDASASGMSQRRADLEAKRAEIEALDLQIKPLMEAEKSGLGRARELTGLMIRRDALARFVKEGGAGLSRGGRIGRAAPAAGEPTESESVILSMMRRRLDRISDLKLRLKVVETRFDRRKIISPVEGRVVTINYLPGDAVDQFATIVTVEESQAAFVDAYIPEGVEVEPHLGDRVAVYSKRSRSTKAHGSVIFVDPGYSVVPERLWFRRLAYYARKFRVKLDADHRFVPGETALVEILGGGSAEARVSAQEAPAPAGPPPAAPAPAVAQVRSRESLSAIELPQALRRKTAFEPSGIAWLPDIGRYVIASDDTGKGDSRHTPAVFLMDGQGRVEPAVTVLHGINEVNDLESIAPAPDGSLYLVSSQNLTKKGNRPQTRQQILKVKRSGRDFTVTGRADFYSALVAAYSGAQLRELGLGETDEDGRLLLNIEGSAFYQGDLLLGIKTPRPAGGALILRVANPDLLIQKQALEPGQVTQFGQVDLRAPDGTPAAISDLLVNEKGQLLALSTVPGASDPQQVGGMYRLKSAGTGKLEAEPLYAFPGLKPEGLCALGNGRYTVIFDTDNQAPFLYLTVEVTGS